MAILQYLGRKHDLVPSDPKALTDLDLLREQLLDLQGMIVSYVYHMEERSQVRLRMHSTCSEKKMINKCHHHFQGLVPSKDKLTKAKESFQASATANLAKVERKLAKIEGKWLTGNKLTYVDFLAYELLDHTRILLSGVEGRRLNQFLADFESLPNIKAYLESDRFSKFPLWSERSCIGLSANDIL